MSANKPLVPTRTGEAPVLAAQQRRWAGDGMSSGAEHGFELRPEVAPLYDASFILCGMFFCKGCGASPPGQTDAPEFSDLSYYRIAELSYEQGWRTIGPVNDVSALCPRCIAQQSVQPDRREDAAPG